MSKTGHYFTFLLLQLSFVAIPVSPMPSTSFESRNSLPSSCADIRASGVTRSGIYTVYPKLWFDKYNISVYCDMETDGGGWTVFQRRADYEVQQSFMQNWNSYRRGFGELDKDFWLGNDNLFILTNQEYVSLRVDIEDFDNVKVHALYNEFRVSGCQDRYRLKIDKFIGSTTNALEYHNNSTFVTFDDGDVNTCAAKYKGGWWYKACHNVNLNGQYETKASGDHLVVWQTNINKKSLKKCEMKIRPTYFSLHRG